MEEHRHREDADLRKGIKQYGSNEGVERAAVYLSEVSTAKLAGVSVWKFFGDFF